MSKRGRKPGSSYSMSHRWERIMVYKDDKKTFESFDLNEEQRLKIPFKTIKRKLKKRSVSSQKPKNKMDQKNLKSRGKDVHLDHDSQVIFTQPENEQQFNETQKIIDVIDQIFDKVSLTDIFNNFE